MTAVALVTAQHVRPETTDDRYLYETLGKRGIAAAWKPWNDPSVDWSQYTHVVLRSCWDYHLQPKLFRDWLLQLALSETRLINPPAQILKTIHKNYLLDLYHAGIPVPALRLIRHGEQAAIGKLHDELAAADLVIKPAISASAWDTYLVNRDQEEFGQLKLESILSDRDVIVQRFVPEVRPLGEYSLVFLGGSYSHAVLKIPKYGDFRSQSDFGGATALVEPRDELIRLADKTLNLFGPLTYARVDMVATDEGPVIMEVELIEPTLYFRYKEGSSEKFVESMLL